MASANANDAALWNDEDGYFGCNICLDAAHNPVVTLCGHLYCWPCIHKWFKVQASLRNGDVENLTCPVCKATVSSNSLVPLYSRGRSSSESAPHRKDPLNGVIPNWLSRIHHRTPSSYPNIIRTQSRSLHRQWSFSYSHGEYTSLATSNLGGAAFASFLHPVLKMFGEKVLDRIFGTSSTNLFLYPYSDSIINPRMRRLEMQLEKSLNRLTVFLLCCIMLCLLLF